MTLRLLRLASFCVFFGRGYQHIFFDAPYRALLWDESLLKVCITSLFNISWHTYVSSSTFDFFIQGSIIVTGVFYLACAFISLFVSRHQWFLHGFIKAGGCCLFLLSLLYFKEHFFQVGHFFELALQWSTPFFLCLYLKDDSLFYKKLAYLKFIIGITFLGHGLYAMGFYPVPGYFLDMLGVVFGLNENYGRFFLKAMGHLDILVFPLIFYKRLNRQVLFFAMSWGLITSLARVVSTLFLSFSFSSIHYSLFETIYRLPHFFIPFLLFLLIRKNHFLQQTKHNQICGV